jgi:hypothetical protein
MDHMVLELEAGRLSPAQLPYLAMVGIALGYKGETLQQLAPLEVDAHGESYWDSGLFDEMQARAVDLAASDPQLTQRLLDELGRPVRSREEAAWELVQTLAKEMVDYRLPLREGVDRLTDIAQAFDNTPVAEAALAWATLLSPELATRTTRSGRAAIRTPRR